MRYIDIKDVMNKIGLGRNWIYKQINDGNFPRPVKLGAQCSRWIESEIDDWMHERAKEREKAA